MTERSQRNPAKYVTILSGNLGAAGHAEHVVTASGAAISGYLNADPLLGSLGTYGGQTPVFPLLPGSAAIHAGTPGALFFALPAHRASAPVPAAAAVRLVGSGRPSPRAGFAPGAGRPARGSPFPCRPYLLAGLRRHAGQPCAWPSRARHGP